MPRRTNTRERLITAAAKLFWRQGYAQTGVHEIISAAGTTSGSFYHFFPAKEDLLLAVVDHVSELLDAEVFAAEDRFEDPLQQILAVIDASRRHLEEHDFALGSPMGMLAAELSASHPQVRERIAGVFEQWTDRVAAMLERAGNRLPPGLDRWKSARFILAAVEGSMLESRARRSLQPFNDAALEIERYLAGLLAGDASAAPARRQQPRPIKSQQPRSDWRAW